MRVKRSHGPVIDWILDRGGDLLKIIVKIVLLFPIVVIGLIAENLRAVFLVSIFLLSIGLLFLSIAGMSQGLQAGQQWQAEHHCQLLREEHGFWASKTYRCDDGAEHTW